MGAARLSEGRSASFVNPLPSATGVDRVYFVPNLGDGFLVVESQCARAGRWSNMRARAENMLHAVETHAEQIGDLAGRGQSEDHVSLPLVEARCVPLTNRQRSRSNRWKRTLCRERCDERAHETAVSAHTFGRRNCFRALEIRGLSTKSFSC